MEMKEFSKGLPWRDVFIERLDRFPGKRARSASRFSREDAHLAEAGPALRGSPAGPNPTGACEEPTLSSDDFNFRAEKTLFQKRPLIPKLFVALVAALFLAILIPWLFTGERPQPQRSDEYRIDRRGAFAGPARAGAKMAEENSSHSRSLAHGPVSTSRPGPQRRPEPLNSSADQTPETRSYPELTPGVSSDSQSRPVAPTPDRGLQVTSLEALSRQLQKIEHQQRECELVLRLLASEPGTFGGFVPDDNLTGISYLTRFQEKIIQLEINKRSLAVRFTPGSREVQAIEMEIQGVRSAMQECLEANLRFLKKDKEALLGQKARLDGKKVPASGDGKTSTSGLSDQSSSGQPWFSVSGGIKALGRGVSHALASFNPPSNPERPARLTRDGGWSQFAAAGQDKPAQRENRAATSLQTVKNDSRAPHRGIFQHVAGESERLGRNPAAMRNQLWESSQFNHHGR